MLEIPLPLLDEFAKGNVMLFIGDRFTRRPDGQALIDGLTNRLAEICTAQDVKRLSFAELAQAIEDETNRNMLIQYVRDYLLKWGDEPQPAHRLIAELTDCRVLISACLDSCLEKAFAQAQPPRQFDLIVSSEGITYQNSARPRLYRLRGLIDYPQSLVLTQQDYWDFFAGENALITELKAHLANKTLLFVEYDLGEPVFQELYYRVIRQLGQHNRLAYASSASFSLGAQRFCKRYHISMFEAPAEDFLQALKAQLVSHKTCLQREADQARSLADLKSDDFRVRAAAVKTRAALGESAIESILPSLADEYPQVRIAAIQALENLQPSGEWREHLQYECYVSAGTFIMGSNVGNDRAGGKDRPGVKPAHEVDLPAYYIGKYLVTCADYAHFMHDRGQAYVVPPRRENYPVVGVNWQEAREYAIWAGMRLPTEAEWEKAASWETNPLAPPSLIEKGGGGIGQKRRYPWGDEFDAARCNTKEGGQTSTTPVDEYSDKGGDGPYGCADMAGNVRQWTSSLAKEYPYDASDGREDEGAPGYRILRGSSWRTGENVARCIYRGKKMPNERHDSYGFRCAWSVRVSE